MAATTDVRYLVTKASTLAVDGDGDGWGAARTSLRVYADPPWVLHLVGELDMASAPVFTRALEALRGDADDIGLDLAELSFIDSTGVRTLHDAVRLVDGRGRVTVFRPTLAVRRVIEMSGLVGTIDVSNDAVPIQRAPTVGARARSVLAQPGPRSRRQLPLNNASQDR